MVVPNDLNWTPHMDVLCNEIQESDERVFKRLPRINDKIFNVPPGTSKTLILSVFSTAWEFAMMPDIKVFVGSYSEAAVSGIADLVSLLVRDERYRRWFPGTVIRRDKNAPHNWKTTANGEFYAFTVGGSLTSKHADILKVDDALNPKMSASEAELKSVNRFFDHTLPSRKVDKNVTVTYLIMQRLHENDPTGHLLEKKPGEIRHVKLPGVTPTLDNVLPAEYRSIYTPVVLRDGHKLVERYGANQLYFLDPARNGVKAMTDMLTDLGSYGFAAQIEQEPAPSKGQIWRKEWFIIVPDHAFPDINEGMAVGTDWDLAYTKDDENAASAYVTSFKYRNRIYLDDLNWAWKEFPELIKWMRTKHPTHYIEAKASGKSARQTLARAGIAAAEVPVKGGSDKVARARMATPVAEAGLVCVRESLADRLFNDPQQGILKFPNGKFKDLADALAQCLQRHNTGGTKYQREQREEDYYSEDDLLSQLGF